MTIAVTALLRQPLALRNGRGRSRTAALSTRAKPGWRGHSYAKRARSANRPEHGCARYVSSLTNLRRRNDQAAEMKQVLVNSNAMRC
jgi:hypothetical protein